MEENLSDPIETIGGKGPKSNKCGTKNATKPKINK